MRQTGSWLTWVLVAAPALAAELPDGRELTNSVGMKLVRVEPGEFTMGCGEAPPRKKEEWEKRDHDESPAHKVKVTKAFFMGATEVTNAQYEQFDPEHRKLRGRHRTSVGDSEPVTMVAWQNAADFCAWLAKKEGKPYRLPTEAEWEYACRAGTTTAFNTGEALTAEGANMVADKKTPTRPAGSYQPNAWGLFDMHGNVEEWCADWYGPYQAGEAVDPVGRADGWVRSARGGSFRQEGWAKDNSRYCRSANRSGFLPEDRNHLLGFRVVLGEAPAAKPLPALRLPPEAPWNRDVGKVPAPKTGPDPAKPFYTNFKGGRPGIPADSWGPVYSGWNHHTAACVCPNGDVLVVWETMVGESSRAMAMAASRLRAGSDKWEPAGSFLDVPDMLDGAAAGPALIVDGERVYFFTTQVTGDWGDNSTIMCVSEDSGGTWSKPRFISRREEIDHMPSMGFAGSGGLLALAMEGSHHLFLSRDRGETWKLAGSGKAADGFCPKQNYHPSAAQLDEKAFVCFSRGSTPMSMYVSTDGGRTWQAGAAPFSGPGVSNKVATLKLASGALLVVTPDDGRAGAGKGNVAALSLDGGRTWPHVRLLPDSGGYQCLAQAPDGVIYDCGTQMRCVAFNEAWLKEGKPVTMTAPPADGGKPAGK